MRCVPGSIRTALYERAIRITSSNAMTSLSAVMMFFDGTMPDSDTIKSRFAQATGRTVGVLNLVSPHSANYMGGVGWLWGWNRTLRVNIDELELALSYAGELNVRNAVGTGVESDPLQTRPARIHRAGTPTWFVVALASSNTFNLNTDALPVSASTAQIYFAAAGSVGDENSSADLKLVGGKLELTQSNPVDLSKAPVISNLRLRLR